MLKNIAVITADYGGKVFESGPSVESVLWHTMDLWLSTHPKAIWLVISNGVSRYLWEKLRAKASLKKQVRTLWSAANGLPNVFVDMIPQIMPKLQEYDYVVKLDSAEHSPEKIDDLCTLALDCNVVVGELDYQPGQLTVCEQLGRDIFSSLLHQCQLPLPISNTHGMQAWKSAVFAEVFPMAFSQWQYIRSNKYPSLSWGMDLSLLLGAYKLGSIPGVLFFPAKQDRKRDPEKIYQQTMAYKIILEDFRDSKIALKEH